MSWCERRVPPNLVWFSRWAVAILMGAFVASKLRLGIERNASYDPWLQRVAGLAEGTLASACALTRWRWPPLLSAVFGLAAMVQGLLATTDAPGVRCGCLGAGLSVSPGQRALLAACVTAAAIVASLCPRAASGPDVDRESWSERLWRGAALVSCAYLASFGLQMWLAP